MKRLTTIAVTAAFAVAGAAMSAGDAEAQIDRRASAFDLGLYGGGSVTSSWYETAGTDYRIGGAPMFGAQGTLWFTPGIGVRLHGGLATSTFPIADRGLFDFGGHDEDHTDRPLNNWFYDLSLAFRPWITDAGAGNLMASTYFFIGGGGLTTSIGGHNQRGFCTFAAEGVCLSRSPSEATVGQGTAGVGFTLFPITPGIGVFAELATHGYSAPVHNDWTGMAGNPNVTRGEDNFAFTTRLVAGLAFAFGDLMPAPPPPPPPAPTPPPPAPEPEERAITVCVVDGTQLREVQATFFPETGDTLVMVAGEQVPFAQAYPTDEQYAAGQQWFVQDLPITFQDRRYVKFGLPRVVSPDQLTYIGMHEGVTVWGEAGVDEPGDAPEVIYIPVRPGCEFQPYQAEEEIRVRG